ncbi:MAG: disulfide oxidoreductase, partial [Pikeienuella sp.]
TLWADREMRVMARGGAAVRRLWDVCQLPDFRKVAPAEHAALVARIYRFLLSPEGAIPSDWIATEISRLDRIEGGIDALSRRLAHMRTWSYVANRGGWLSDPGEWRGRAREVEDRLSDALHLALTREFVDRRTSVLMRRLKQKERLVAEVTETGEVTAEGEHLGRIDGFRFIADPAAGAEEQKRLRAASLGALQGWFAHRADKFYNAPDSEIDVTEQGGLMWGEVAVGRLEPGADALSPQIRAFTDEMLEPPLVQKIERRLGHWINRRIAAQFAPLIALRDDEALTGLARGVAYQLVEGLGVLERRPIAEDVKALNQEARTLLRKHGVRFGQHSVFMPLLLKPAPTRLRLVLWGLKEKLEEIPASPPPGLVTIPAEESAPDGFYIRAGYRRAGARAIRIDMLERLADMLRDKDARTGFEATADMLSITGLTLEQFADLMRGLGFVAEQGERAKAPKPAAAPKPETETEAKAETGETPETEAAPVTEEAPAEPVAEDTAPEPPADAPATEAPAGETAEEAAPATAAEPETEIFFTFSIARRPPRGARTGDKGREGQGRRPAKTGKPHGGKKGGPRGAKPGDGPKGGQNAGPRPPREKVADPDSPFAILKQLKS